MFIKKIIAIITLTLAGFGSWYFYSKSTAISPYKQFAQLIPYTYRIGFTNLEQELNNQPLVIQGTIPYWLNGTLLRNGPAKFSTETSWVKDWFDGLAMIHAFSFNNGQVIYSNKYLHSNDYKKVHDTGSMSYAGFAQDPCSSKFKNLFALFMPNRNNSVPNARNANVNIAQYTDKFIALTEVPLPIEFNPVTLETIGVYSYNDGLPETNIHDTPHPHYDPVRKEHLGYFTRFGRTSSHNLFRIKDGTTNREIIASIEVEKPSYMHSFAITEHYAILTGLPLIVNPLDLLLKKAAFIKNFRWKPELGTKFMIIDRINNKLLEIIIGEPFFAFHTINAFEKNNIIVIDIIIYPNSNGIGHADIDKILDPIHEKTSVSVKNTHAADADPADTGTFKRFIIDLKSKTITSKIICPESIELPRINYAGYNGKEYTYVYAFAKNKPGVPYVANKLVKINVTTGDMLTWHKENCFPGEPVFVPKPGARLEDDGIVLSVILDAAAQRSFLLILDATTFTEIGRAHVPHHIPFGIHGIYCPHC